GKVGMRLKAAVMAGVSMHQIQDGISDLSAEVIFGQDNAVCHFALQGFAEELYVLHALHFYLQSRRGRWRSCRFGLRVKRGAKTRDSKACTYRAQVVEHRRKTDGRVEC